MKLLDKLPGFCEPVGLQFDAARMNASVDAFLKELFQANNMDLEKYTRNAFATVNLTHMPHVTGRDRFFKYTGNKYALMKNNIEEKNFTLLPIEVERTYFGKMIRQIEQYHLKKFGTPFVGRYQLIWVNSMSCYPLHVDKHTPHRYHVALKTNPDCWWVFRDKTEDISLMHMPVDGRVWYLDPIQQEHSVANMGQTPRCHLLMTSSS